MRFRIICWSFCRELKLPVKSVYRSFVGGAAAINQAQVQSTVTDPHPRQHLQRRKLFSSSYPVQPLFGRSKQYCISLTYLSGYIRRAAGIDPSSVIVGGTISNPILLKQSVCHTRFICLCNFITGSTGLVTPPVIIITSRQDFHLFSTNSTSVSPPPTPSTQSECLPATEADSHDEIQIPEPPNNCCMSGCANCVWITYAQDLAELYKDSGKAADSVMNAIDDPSLKFFLNLELKDKLSSDIKE